MSNHTSSETGAPLNSDDVDETLLIGKIFQQAREQIKMTTAEVASKLNLDVRYIEAIEANDFSSIPGRSYVYGYIRTYAKLLKLPEKDIMASYQLDTSDDAKLLPEYLGQKKLFSGKTKSNFVMVLILLVISSLLFLTWWMIRN